jgi:hypothetical protein
LQLKIKDDFNNEVMNLKTEKTSLIQELLQDENDPAIDKDLYYKVDRELLPNNSPP